MAHEVKSFIYVVPEKEIGGSASRKFSTRVEWTERGSLGYFMSRPATLTS